MNWNHSLVDDYSDHEQRSRYMVRCGTCGKSFDRREDGDCPEHTECANCGWEALPSPCLACKRRAEHERDYASFEGVWGIGLPFACPMILCTKDYEHEHCVNPARLAL